MKIIKNAYGQKIAIDDDTDLISRRIVRNGFFDRCSLYYIERFLSAMSPPPVCLDVGANIGNHALIMQRMAAMVYLFEPQTALVDLLHKTADLNQITNWKISGFGLSDSDKALDIFIRKKGNSGGGTINDSLRHKGHEYFCQKSDFFMGDHVVKDHGINKLDFIKIDVEGSETEVIIGLEESIQKFRPVIMIEWNCAITKEKFINNEISTGILKQYTPIGIDDKNHHAGWIMSKLMKARRKLSKKIFREHWHPVKFEPSNNYETLFFVPDEKICAFDFIRPCRHT